MHRNRSIGIWVLTVSVCTAVVAQEAEPPNALLRGIEAKIRKSLPNHSEMIRCEYPEGQGALIVNYKTRPFVVYGQSRIGKYHDQPHETVGPSYQGFRWRLTLQDAGTVNAAATPQTLQRPYWKTRLDVYPLKGTDKQLFSGLSYGSRVEQDLLKQLNAMAAEFGKGAAGT